MIAFNSDLSLCSVQDHKTSEAQIGNKTTHRNPHEIWVMSLADHNVLSLFVCIHPGVSSQNTRAEMKKPGFTRALAFFFPTQMFDGTQETGLCASIVSQLFLCLSSNISN